MAPDIQDEIERLGNTVDNFLDWLLIPAVPLRKVDVIAETADGHVGVVEAKAPTTVTLADLRHLARVRDLMDASVGQFIRGVVLYTGDQVLPFGDRLIAMPLAGLWRAIVLVAAPPRHRLSRTNYYRGHDHLRTPPPEPSCGHAGSSSSASSTKPSSNFTGSDQSRGAS